VKSVVGVERVRLRYRLGFWEGEIVGVVEDPPEWDIRVPLANEELARVVVESRSAGESEEALELDGREYCVICVRVWGATESTEGVETEVVIDSLGILLAVDSL